LRYGGALRKVERGMLGDEFCLIPDGTKSRRFWTISEGCKLGRATVACKGTRGRGDSCSITRIATMDLNPSLTITIMRDELEITKVPTKYKNKEAHLHKEEKSAKSHCTTNRGRCLMPLFVALRRSFRRWRWQRIHARYIAIIQVEETDLPPLINMRPRYPKVSCMRPLE
jgi:hypothetical protein